jgi:hypothetical protein
LAGEPMNGYYGSQPISSMGVGQQGFAQEPCVDPRNLMRQEPFTQDYGNYGHVQLGYEAGVDAPLPGAGLDYLNTPLANVSAGDGLDMSS